MGGFKMINKGYLLMMFLPMLFVSHIVYGTTNIKIYSTNIRYAYFRGEEVPLQIEVTNNSAKAINDAQLSIDIAGVVVQSVGMHKIEKGAHAEHIFRVNSLFLKAGEYKATCKLNEGENVISKEQFTIWIARRWNPDRMRVWLWPHGAFGATVTKLDDTARKRLQWWTNKGFNSFIPHGELNSDQFKVFDYALFHGMEMGFLPYGGLNMSKDPGDTSIRVKVARGQYVDDPFNPKIARKQDSENTRLMKKLRDFPGVKTAFVNTEKEDYFRLFETEGAKRLMQEKLGPITEQEFIAPGVIRDTDEEYVKGIYRYKYGDGLTTLNSRVAKIVHKYRPDILVFNDPFRRAAIYDRFRDLDTVTTWTYTNPDPKLILFIENLITAAKPASQKIMQTITLLNYGGGIAPIEKGGRAGRVLMRPDKVVETSWICFSRRPDGLGYYIGSDLDPFNKLNDFILSPKTYDALKKFVNEVVKPYGPMIANLERCPRKTAVLNSFSSRVISASPNLRGYYANNQINHFYTVLNMAHIPADVIFDETIQRYGLDDYDVLILPKCDTLLESAYKKILAFKKKGGLVISDQYLGAEIPDVIKFDFDFTYRDKVSADAIMSGEMIAEWDDHINELTAKREKVKGITALADQKIMESYAQKLRDSLKGKVYREVDCSTPTALLNMLKKDSVKYLFVINDKRTYGDQVGKWKATLEKTVPQTVTITLNEWKYPDLYVYDLIEKKLLKFKEVSGGYQFNVDLPAPGGKIIAFYPEEFDKIDISVPTEMKKGVKYKIEINVISSKGTLLPGVQPLQVEIKDPKGNISEFSDYYAAKNGSLSIDFISALNDISGKWTIEVRDLTAGITVEKNFSL